MPDSDLERVKCDHKSCGDAVTAEVDFCMKDLFYSRVKTIRLHFCSKHAEEFLKIVSNQRLH